MRGKYQVVLLALFAMALLIVPTAARAGTNLGMELSSGASSVTLCDNNVGFTGCLLNTPDGSPTLGQILFVGDVGGWQANVTTGEGPPLLTLPHLMDLDNITMTTNGAAPLTMTLTVTGLTAPLGNVNFLNAIGGTNSFAGTTLSIQSWLSNSNTAFCTNSGCGVQGINQSATGLAFSGSSTGLGTTGAGPYSLTLVITLDSHGQADITSFDDFLSIPEPATLSVLGTGLLALGTGLRKKLFRG
jgi:hypothetical protein